ncbi:hypothetical protein GINT2_000780 [Glugoides intestinalis]
MSIKKLIKKYNESYHRSIVMLPSEAMLPVNHEEVKRNQYEARIDENLKFLKKGNWLKLRKGDRVLIKDELRKSKKGLRFKTGAIIKEVLGFDTYKLEKNKGGLCKRQKSQLKKL